MFKYFQDELFIVHGVDFWKKRIKANLLDIHQAMIMNLQFLMLY